MQYERKGGQNKHLANDFKDRLSEMSGKTDPRDIKSWELMLTRTGSRVFNGGQKEFLLSEFEVRK